MTAAATARQERPMPRKKTVTAPVADVIDAAIADATIDVSTEAGAAEAAKAAVAIAEAVIEAAAVEPEPVAEPAPEPRTGATFMTKRLLQFIDEAETTFEDEKAKMLEYMAINPRQALESRGRSMAHAQAQYDIAMRMRDRFDYEADYAAQHDGATALKLIDRDLARLRENVLHDFYRASSTCQLHNALEAETRAAICDALRDYDNWMIGAASIDAGLAAKAAREVELQTEIAPGVTLADYEALRREHRTEQLRATNIDDVVAQFKAAGLKYLGQRKVDLIRLLVAREFDVKK